jgi:flagellin-like hook-associated protein FlgL
MPIVVNSNASATEASFNLSRANDALRKSLQKLSTGKRINSPADDAGGLAVAYKLSSTIKRSYAVVQNAQNALSYLQVQDSGLKTVGNILDRMSELRVMAQDITKNAGDIENYSKEFLELQSQLNQISRETFNGISLFATETSAVQTGEITGVSDSDLRVDGTFAYTANDGTAVQYDKFGRTFFSHPSGQATDGSISLNVVNLQFVLSIGTLDVNRTLDIDLGGLQNFDPNQVAGAGAFSSTTPRTDGGHDNARDMHATDLGNTIKGQAIPVSDSSNAVGIAAGVTGRYTDGANDPDDDTSGINANGFITTILDVDVGQFTEAIERLADMRAENGAEQNRVMNSINLLQTNVTNLEAAHGRIMDADIALESTRFARQNVLVQASASMTAQANQLTNIALTLLQ